MTNNTKTPENKFATIPGFRNYKVNRTGTRIINKISGKDMAISYRENDHWTGSVKLKNNKGLRTTINMQNAVMTAFRIKYEETAWSLMTFVQAHDSMV